MNGSDYRILSVQELNEQLKRAQESKYADLALTRNSEAKPKSLEKLLYRAAGVKLPTEDASMQVLVNGERAFVIFVEDDDNNFHSVNTESVGYEGEMVDFVLGNGQHDEYPARECVSTQLALSALISFFETGEKTSAIRWSKD